jgi:hypothetical protein
MTRFESTNTINMGKWLVLYGPFWILYLNILEYDWRWIWWETPLPRSYIAYKKGNELTELRLIIIIIFFLQLKSFKLDKRWFENIFIKVSFLVAL